MSKPEKVIEIIKKYAIIYDVSHIDYKNIRKKDKVWTEIGKELNENGEEVKKKWKNLRDTYTKYVKACKKTKTKKWIWADQMEVFLPFLTSSDTCDMSTVKSTINGVSKDDSENSMELSDGIQIQSVESEYFEHDGLVPEVEPLDNQLPQHNSDISVEVVASKRRFTTSNCLGETMNYIEQSSEFDATDCLLLAHAKTIKTFSGRRQAITKLKIAELIMEQELLHLDDLGNVDEIGRPESSNSYHCETRRRPVGSKRARNKP